MTKAASYEPGLFAKLVIAFPLAARRWRGVSSSNGNSRRVADES
jgi:hypothetical protein